MRLMALKPQRLPRSFLARVGVLATTSLRFGGLSRQATVASGRAQPAASMAAAQGTRSRSSSLDRPEDYPSARRDSLRRAVDPDPGLAPPTKRLRAGHEVEAGPQERETRFHSASSHDRPSENASSQLPPIVTREERHGTGDRHSWSPSTPYQIDAAGEPRAGMVSPVLFVARFLHLSLTPGAAPCPSDPLSRTHG